MHGHVYTIAPWIGSLVRKVPAPPSQHFRTTLLDPRIGPVRLTGRFHPHRGARSALVVVHGLGGSAESPYARLAAAAAARAGMASLRLNLRGADRSGEDYYHAGLTDDLRAAIGSTELASFDRVHLLGYSLGGHVTLRYAAEDPDPRVASVAAVCPPLDLMASAEAIDHPRRALYRRHILRGLKEIYGYVASRRPVPIPVAEARRITTMRDWDENVVAPRHGFASAEDYWRRMSVAPLLDHLATPALVVATERDPMVLEETVRPVLDTARGVKSIWLSRGGHVGFPAGTDLSLGTRGELEDQLVAWLSDPR